MDQPWLRKYPENVPHTIEPNQYESLVAMFEKSAQAYGDLPAFTNMGSTLTFRELEEKSRAFAAYLQQGLKLEKGTRIALMMPNLLQYPVALLGVLRAGMIVVNVNPLYTPRELKHQLNDAGVNTIVLVSNFAHNFQQIMAETQVEHVMITSLGQMLPQAKGTLVDFVVKYIKRLVPKYRIPHAVSFRHVMDRGHAMTYERPHVSGQDIALLQYTGGTTGTAKGAILSHSNLIANVLQAKAAYGARLSEGKECVVTALPLYHIFALSVNCLLFIELGGQNLLITNPRDIPKFVKELQRHSFTAMTGVNTLFNALLHHAPFLQLDFSQMHLSVAGGAAVQKGVADEWHRVTGQCLLEGYGLTECSPLVSGNPYNSNDYTGSIGVPVPSTEVRIVDDQGHVLPWDQTGEMQVRGPQVMQGYWQRPEATKAVLSEDGWLATGDIVRMDEAGMLYIVDRKKDMILVSGFNVYPNEIEDVVSMHPKVIEAAAVGVPHDVSGEMVKLFVVAKDPSLTKEEVLQHCRQYLTGYKVPKRVEFRHDLPKTNVGKVIRRALKEEVMAASNLASESPHQG